MTLDNTSATLDNTSATLDNTPATLDNTPATLDNTPATLDNTPATLDNTPATLDNTPVTLNDTPARPPSTKPTVDEIGRILTEQGRTLGVAESLTGGQLAAAFAEGDDASTWFRGAVVAYATAVKRELLGVPEVPAVSEQCARALAAGAARVLGADLTVAVTGVGGPDRQDGQPPGTVWLATCDGGAVEARFLHAVGSPPEVCGQAVAAAVAAVGERLGVESLDVVKERGGRDGARPVR